MQIGNCALFTLEVMSDGGTTRDPNDHIHKQSAEKRPGCHGRKLLQFSRRKLQMKLEGPRVGFHRKIREPTINRPGLALSGFYTYFAEKRVQVLGAAEHSYLKSLPSKLRVKRFRKLRSEEHTSELQSHHDLVCRLLLEKKKAQNAKRS